MSHCTNREAQTSDLIGRVVGMNTDTHTFFVAWDCGITHGTDKESSIL